MTTLTFLFIEQAKEVQTTLYLIEQAYFLYSCTYMYRTDYSHDSYFFRRDGSEASYIAWQ